MTQYYTKHVSVKFIKYLNVSGLDVSGRVSDTSIIVLRGLWRVTADDDGGCCVSFGLWAEGLNVFLIRDNTEAGQGCFVRFI